MKKNNNLMSVTRDERGGAAPYLIAWVLGVPGSILLLIFLFRSVF